MNIGVIGATGYAGLELLRLLAQHPEKKQVTAVTSRQDCGRRLTEVFPALSGLKTGYDHLIFDDPENPDLFQKADFFFTATPHGTAMKLVPGLLKNGGRVVDLSADFRLTSLETFEQWYQPHEAPELLPEAIYGLPELYADKIKTAKLVANPGCYPTSVILGLAPFLKAGLLEAGWPIIADSKSGVSGAGRSASMSTSFCEVHDSFKAYKITGHRHTPEIEQEISLLHGSSLMVSFTPHLAPMNRGILSTIYVGANKEIDLAELKRFYDDFYKGSPFVRVRPLGAEPQTSEVRGGNFCDISLFIDSRTKVIKIVSVIDNLCRGAAGQAVANFNLMNGWPETAGLDISALRP